MRRRWTGKILGRVCSTGVSRLLSRGTSTLGANILTKVLLVFLHFAWRNNRTSSVCHRIAVVGEDLLARTGAVVGKGLRWWSRSKNVLVILEFFVFETEVFNEIMHRGILCTDDKFGLGCPSISP